MDRVLGERLRVITLVDAYGRLLTERQQRLLRMYYLHDLSLGEIAEELTVTRQAVFDGLHRAADALERLEGSLHAVEQRRAVAERADALEHAIRNLAGHLDRGKVSRLLKEVAALRKVALST